MKEPVTSLILLFVTAAGLAHGQFHSLGIPNVPQAAGGPDLRESETKIAAPGREVRFAGYSWTVKVSSTPVGPGPNVFAEDNVWVDPLGRLHLRVVRRDGYWACAEVVSQLSLGFGTYTFTIADTAQLSPATVLGLFTWDDHGEEFHHREIDIEIGRWGEADSQNAQFVVQPGTVAGNLVRFELPSGQAVASFDWTLSRVYCRSTRLRAAFPGEQDFVQDHSFVAGIPPAGDARVRINLWRFGTEIEAGGGPEEVVIEDFRFSPKK